jgi:hypothetical protein
MSSKTSKTNKTNKTSASKKHPLSLTLKTIPAVTGIERLRDLTNKFGLIPHTVSETIDALLHDLETTFVELNISAYELAADSARILGIVAGVPANQVTQYHRSETAEPLHAYRNLILAIATLAAATIGVVSPATAPGTIYAHSVKLARRSTQTRRPFTDDEIVLCRVAAYLAAQTSPRNHTSFIYTLVEAGMVPGESTHTRIDDFDDPEMPMQLLAAGNGHLAARFLTLDTFARHITSRHMALALRAGYDARSPLTYKPRDRGAKTHESGSASATASAQRVLDRFIDELRLPTGDITASSITQWRVASTLEHQSFEQALAVSGRKKMDAMLRALGTTRRAPTTRPDDDGESFAAAI